MNIKSQTRLTIAIPYYSRPEFLLQAIESVFAQTNPNWCLVVFDDNPSTPLDKTLIKPYLNDPRFTYSLNSENLGIGGNWNQCVNKCNTEFLTILHSDDMLSGDYVDQILDAMDRYPNVTASFCEAEIIDDHSRPKFSFPDKIKHFLKPSKGDFLITGEDGTARLLRGNFIMCPTLCYRMSRIRTDTFSSSWKMVLDLDFYIRELIAGGSFIGLNRSLYKYRRHENNQTSVLGMNRFNEEIAFYLSLVTKLEEINWHKAAKTARQFWMIKLHIAFHFLIDLVHLRLGTIAQKYKLLRLS